MEMNRRQFLRVSGAGLAASTLVALGFSPLPALAETRHFKLARATETRNTCPYCSVGCGLIIHSLGDHAKNARSIHHPHRGRSGPPGQPRHPVSQGLRACSTSCTAPTRLKVPPGTANAGGTNEWKRRCPGTSRSTASRRLMKADRDANFIADESRTARPSTDGLSTGMLCASASIQRDRLPHPQDDGALARHAGLRQPGARLTRTDGGQSGPTFGRGAMTNTLEGHQERRCRADHGRECRRGPSLAASNGSSRQAIDNKRQADRGRPAFHALGRQSPTTYAPIRPGHRHRLPGRRDPLPAGARTRSSTNTSKRYTNASFIVKEGFKLRGRAVLRL
jgi:formate dehydrogenase major subunit